jgi:hypothetical protein
MLWGATVAHAARIWQLRCIVYGIPADESRWGNGGGGKGDDDEEAVAKHATVVHLAQWPPALVPAPAEASLRTRGSSFGSSVTPPRLPPPPGHTRTRSV